MKPLRILTGILGAVLGTLLGVGLLLILDQFGYERVDWFVPKTPGLQAYFSYGFWIFALASGLGLSVLTLWLCRAWGGGFHPATLAVCVVLLLAVPFFADWASWAITHSFSYSVIYPFGHYFRLVPSHIEWGVGFPDHASIDAALYTANLATLYAGVAAGGAVFRLLKKNRH